MIRPLSLRIEFALCGLMAALAVFALADCARGEELPAPVATIEPIPATPDPLFRFGTPEGTVINEGRFCLAFDGRTRQARWVLEHLTADTLKGDADRVDNFYADPRIPVEFRPTLGDYSGSRFDRGHLVPAGDFGQACDKGLTFGLANISPQVPAFNRGPWKALEQHIRTLAAGESQIWVCTMPLYLSARGRVTYRVIGDGVAVPTHFGKATLLIDEANKLHLRAWIAPNEKPPTGITLDDWRVSIDELERSAGLDLWSGLPDDMETKLEAAK